MFISQDLVWMDGRAVWIRRMLFYFCCLEVVNRATAGDRLVMVGKIN